MEHSLVVTNSGFRSDIFSTKLFVSASVIIDPFLSS